MTLLTLTALVTLALVGGSVTFMALALAAMRKTELRLRRVDSVYPAAPTAEAIAAWDGEED